MMKKYLLPGFLVISLSLMLSSCSSSDGVTQESTPFQPAATQDLILYEIHPSAFSSTHDFQGIINRLDNIKALGVNTIWIMPIYPIGQVNSFGSLYCVKDYTSVRSSLGTLENLKTLVTAAHQKGIAVLLDWVGNHTSWDNPWITAHPEWYTHDGSGNIISPAGTGWNDVADLNYDNAAMRLAMIVAMKYWVTTADIDGFRCDAANYIPSDFWLQATTALNAIPNKHLILLAEGNQVDQFNAGFQMNFGWDYLSALKNVFGTNQADVSTLFITNSNEYLGVPAGKRKLRFITNHDESYQATPNAVYGSADGAIAAFVLSVFMDGVPLLYSGQEVGVSSPTVYTNNNTIDWNANPSTLVNYQQILGYYTLSTAAKSEITTNYSTSNVAFFVKGNGIVLDVVIVNTRNTPQTIAIPSALQGTWYNFNGAYTELSTTLTLAPFQYFVLHNGIV